MSEKSISVGRYFECLDCKNDVIEEIQMGVVLSSPVTDLHSDEHMVEAEYSNNVAWDGGAVVLFSNTP